jgi:hypothetical protein
MKLLTREMAAAIALIVCSVAGCSSPPEEAVLGQFFAAARLRDTTALASFATIRFDPRIDGVVTDFEVTHAGPEQRRPIPGTDASRDGAANAESEIVRLSAGAVRSSLDLTRYEGQMRSKEVTIEASVKTPDGGVVQKTMIVMVQRVILKADPEIVGRWIVTSIR